MKALILDDNASFRVLLSSVCRSYDINTDETKNIKEATDLALTNKYDIYFVDGDLSDGSGVDFCLWLKKKNIVEHVIFISTQFKSLEEFENLKDIVGVDLVINKPIKTIEMKQICEHLIGKSNNVSIDNEEDYMVDLREKYVKSIKTKLVKLNDLIKKTISTQDEETIKTLIDEIHKISGSAGTYGFEFASDFCHQMEFVVKDMCQTNNVNEEILHDFMRQLKNVFQLNSY